MTDEKAQARLQQLYNDFLPIEYDFTEYDTEDAKLDREAIQMGIKALELQASEDCISRQATISAIQDKYYDNAIGIDIVDMIAHMPAAIPEQLGEHFAEGYKKGVENEQTRT